MSSRILKSCQASLGRLLLLGSVCLLLCSHHLVFCRDEFPTAPAISLDAFSGNLVMGKSLEDDALASDWYNLLNSLKTRRQDFIQIRENLLKATKDRCQPTGEENDVWICLLCKPGYVGHDSAACHFQNVHPSERNVADYLSTYVYWTKVDHELPLNDFIRFLSAPPQQREVMFSNYLEPQETLPDRSEDVTPVHSPMQTGHAPAELSSQPSGSSSIDNLPLKYNPEATALFLVLIQLRMKAQPYTRDNYVAIIDLIEKARVDFSANIHWKTTDHWVCVECQPGTLGTGDPYLHFRHTHKVPKMAICSHRVYRFAPSAGLKKSVVTVTQQLGKRRKASALSSQKSGSPIQRSQTAHLQHNDASVSSVGCISKVPPNAGHPYVCPETDVEGRDPYGWQYDLGFLDNLRAEPQVAVSSSHVVPTAVDPSAGNIHPWTVSPNSYAQPGLSQPAPPRTGSAQRQQVQRMTGNAQRLQSERNNSSSPFSRQNLPLPDQLRLLHQSNQANAMSRSSRAQVSGGHLSTRPRPYNSLTPFLKTSSDPTFSTLNTAVIGITRK